MFLWYCFFFDEGNFGLFELGLIKELNGSLKY